MTSSHSIFRTNKNGFGMIEIVLALAIFLILMVAVFQYSSSLFKTFSSHGSDLSEAVFPHGLDLYRYGENVCAVTPDISVFSQIDLSGILSTSTPVTHMHYVGNQVFVLTADSASTTEADIFLIRQIDDTHVQLITTKDVGPGIQDSVLLFPYLYIANTSVNSHVKVLRIDSMSLTEIQNIKIDSLSQSNSMPRKLSIYGDHLILGAEKSNTGAELFDFSINTQTGLLSLPLRNAELGGQAHTARVVGKDLFIANSADPEMRVFDQDFKEKKVYDAPLTLGNGKSILSIYPYVLLGRTLGSGELTLLDISTSTIVSVDTDRTNGSVDELQGLASSQTNTFMVLTSNADKEIQFWSIGTNHKLHLDKYINLPARATSYTCVDAALYVSTLVNEKPYLIILK